MHPSSNLIPLSIAEHMTGLSKAALRAAIHSGRVTGYQPGGPKGKLFVSRSDLEQLLTPLEAKK